MTIQLVLEMIAAAVLAAGFYTIIGVAPGTDETAVLAPVTLALVLLGVPPVVVLAFFCFSSCYIEFDGCRSCSRSRDSRRRYGVTHGSLWSNTQTSRTICHRH